ncbi:unnamed protein product [Amoebophrya sp. A120]|nr:unnamed protein product [Amoebophrya sp. A120]|eukprot:GSA120T00003219001.1
MNVLQNMRMWSDAGFTEDQKRKQNDLLEKSKAQLPKLGRAFDLKHEEGLKNAYILKSRASEASTRTPSARSEISSRPATSSGVMSTRATTPAGVSMSMSRASSSSPTKMGTRNSGAFARSGSSSRMQSGIKRSTTVQAVAVEHEQYVEQMQALGVNTDTDVSRPGTAPAGSIFGSLSMNANPSSGTTSSMRPGSSMNYSRSSRINNYSTSMTASRSQSASTRGGASSSAASMRYNFDAETLEKAAARHDQKRKLRLGGPRNPLFEGHWQVFKKQSVVSLEREYKIASKKKVEERKIVRDAHYALESREKGLNMPPEMPSTAREMAIVRARRWRDEVMRRRIRDDVASLFNMNDLMRDFEKRVKKVREKLLKAQLDPQIMKIAEALAAAVPTANTASTPTASSGNLLRLLQGDDDGRNAEFLDSIARQWPYGYKTELFKWLGRLFKGVIAVETGRSTSQDENNKAVVKQTKSVLSLLKANPKHAGQIQKLFAIIDRHFLPKEEEYIEDIDEEAELLKKKDFNLEARLDVKEKQRIDDMLALKLGVHAPRWKGFGEPIYGSPQFYGLAPEPEPPEATPVVLSDTKEFEKRGLELFRSRLTSFGTAQDERRNNQEKARDVYTQLQEESDFYRNRKVPPCAWNANETLLGSVWYVDFLWEVLEKKSLQLEQKKEFVRLIAQQRAIARRDRDVKSTVENVELFPARQTMLEPLAKGKEETHEEALERIQVNVDLQRARTKKQLYLQRRRCQTSLGLLFNRKIDMQALQGYLARNKFGDVDQFLKNFRESHPNYHRPESAGGSLPGAEESVSYTMGKNIYRKLHEGMDQLKKSKAIRKGAAGVLQRARKRSSSRDEETTGDEAAGEDAADVGPIAKKKRSQDKAGARYLQKSSLVVPRGIVKALVESKHSVMAMMDSGEETHDMKDHRQKRLLAMPKSDPVLKQHLERVFMKVFAQEMKARSIVLTEKQKSGSPSSTAEISTSSITSMLHQLRHLDVSEKRIQQCQQMGLCNSDSMTYDEWTQFYNMYCHLEIEDLAVLFHQAVRARRLHSAAMRALMDDKPDLEPVLDVKGFLALLMRGNSWSLLGESYLNDLVEAIRGIFDDCAPTTHKVHVLREEEEDEEDMLGANVKLPTSPSSPGGASGNVMSSTSPASSTRKTNLRLGGGAGEVDATDEDNEDGEEQPDGASKQPTTGAEYAISSTMNRPPVLSKRRDSKTFVDENTGEVFEIVELRTINFGQFARMYYYAVKSHGFSRDEMSEIEDAFEKFHAKFQLEAAEISDKVRKQKEKIRLQRRFQMQSQIGLEFDPNATASETEAELEMRMLTQEEKLERWAVESSERAVLINVKKSIRPMLNWLGFAAEELPEKEIDKRLAQVVTHVGAQNKFGTVDLDGPIDLMRKMLAEGTVVPLPKKESEALATVAEEQEVEDKADAVYGRRPQSGNKPSKIQEAKYLPPEGFCWFTFPQTVYALSLFREYFAQSVCDRFMQADVDGSGGVDSEELANILSVVNQSSVTQEFLQDLYTDIGKDLDDELTLEEFNEVYKLYRTRAGFSNNEIVEFHAAFDKFAEPLSKLKRIEETKKTKLLSLVNKTAPPEGSGMANGHTNGAGAASNGAANGTTAAAASAASSPGEQEAASASPTSPQQPAAAVEQTKSRRTTASSGHQQQQQNKKTPGARGADSATSSEDDEQVLADMQQDPNLRGSRRSSLATSISAGGGEFGGSRPGSPSGRHVSIMDVPGSPRSRMSGKGVTTSQIFGSASGAALLDDEQDQAWIDDMLFDPETMRTVKDNKSTKHMMKMGFMKLKFARHLRKALQAIRQRPAHLQHGGLQQARHDERDRGNIQNKQVLFLAVSQLDKVFRWLGYDAMPDYLIRKSAELGIDFAVDRYDFLKIAKAVKDVMHMSFSFRWAQISHLNPLDNQRYCTFASLTSMLKGLGYATSVAMANRAALETCPALDWILNRENIDPGTLAMMTVSEPIAWPTDLSMVQNEETRKMLKTRQRVTQQRAQLLKNRRSSSSSASLGSHDSMPVAAAAAVPVELADRVDGEDSFDVDRQVTEEVDDENEIPAHLPVFDPRATATSVNFDPVSTKQDLFETVLKDKWMSEKQCRDACSAARRMAKENYQKYSGFSDVEVLEFKQQFMRHAVRVSDLTEDRALFGFGLRKVLLDLFPDATRDPAVHALMADVLDAVDRDRSGTIDFAEYLQIMRVHTDAKQNLL